jgi:hypothetical protein
MDARLLSRCLHVGGRTRTVSEGFWCLSTDRQNSDLAVLSSRSASGATARNRKGSYKIAFAPVHVALVTYRSSSAPATLKAIVWNSSTAAFYIRMGSAGRRTVSCDNFRRANDSIFVGGES